MLISHAHGDHDQGAALLQSRYGAKVVMGAADWDADAATCLAPRRWRAEARHRRGAGRPKITLGDTTVDVIATPGHTPGTLSYLFPVKDRGRTLNVARILVALRSTFRGRRRHFADLP